MDMNLKILAAAVVLTLPAAQGAQAQDRPCAQAAQSFDRGTDPRAVGCK
jgi:hypothetical protein